MTNYKAMYFALAAKVADAIELLMLAQQAAEEQYTSEEGSSPEGRQE
jgi:hypothetical protein